MSVREEEGARPRPTSPWEELLRLEEAMNRFMDEVFGAPRLGRPAPARRGPAGTIAERAWTPAVDIIDREDRLVVMVYLPGVPREAIEITLEEGVLRVSGHRPQPEDVRPQDYQLCESRYGPFLRTIQLPNNLDLSRVEAVLRDGILTVTVPKAMDRGSKRIEIRVG